MHRSVRRTRRSARRSGLLALTALLLASGLVACGGDDPRPESIGAPITVPTGPGATATAGTEPSAVATPTGTPSASSRPTRSPTPKPKRSAGPRRTAKKPTETKVPPAPPRPVSNDCKPRYSGSAASRGEVKAALVAAAGRTYWPTSAPTIRIPVDLVKATAWQESGWQSNIVACDGGIGLMQVMPATATWMNQRFEQSYQVRDYTDNAYLGANYLAWLTKYIGDMYFDQDYRLSAELCTSELDSCLLNAVIAAYNFGHAAVAEEGEPLRVPNPQYVRNVRALMTECVCLGY